MSWKSLIHFNTNCTMKPNPANNYLTFSRLPERKSFFLAFLDRKVQSRRKYWSGNSRLKAGWRLSCAMLVMHSLLLTSPISSGPCFTLKVREKKGEKKAVVLWVGEQLLSRELRGSGVQVWQAPALSVYLFRDLPSEARQWKEHFTICVN